MAPSPVARQHCLLSLSLARIPRRDPAIGDPKRFRFGSSLLAAAALDSFRLERDSHHTV
jgi:hypothetical protein